ncbi:MAG: preprotein translocase subunit YajC [Oscillospiraceae bacterium]|nr:preprotein translocase subunit YajC [Oscillospiraceae bacterium]
MFFLEAAAAADATAGAGMLGSPIIMIVLMLGVFYFLMIRPENKKKKQLEEMRGNLKPGDEITTIGGVIGTVVNVKDDNIVIEVGADRVRLEFSKWAVSTNNSAMREAEKAKAAAAAKRKEEKEAKKAKKD